MLEILQFVYIVTLVTAVIVYAWKLAADVRERQKTRDASKRSSDEALDAEMVARDVFVRAGDDGVWGGGGFDCGGFDGF